MVMLRRAMFRVATAAAVILGLGIPAGTAAHAAPPALPRVGPWQATGHTLVSSLFQNQGLATVELPGGGTTLWYDGNLSIPPLTYARGWQHVGDPDSVRGYVAEPYQWGPANPVSKMFRVWTPAPARRSYDFVHRLTGDEQMNNSFTAITPNGQWLVSGEWGTENRLLVYPMPLLNPAAPDPKADLPLTGRVLLDHPVGNVQGCTFLSPLRLLCSSDETAGALFGVVKPLLQVNLAAPLSGHDVAAHVTALGALPLQSPCRAPASGFEVEGLDYDRHTGSLRVEVIQPGLCLALTTVWEFHHIA